MEQPTSRPQEEKVPGKGGPEMIFKRVHLTVMKTESNYSRISSRSKTMRLNP